MGPEGELSALVRQELEQSDLGHGARHRRLLQVAKALALAPTHSLPDVFEDWASLKGAYRFFSNEAVRPEAIRSGHVTQTRERCRREKSVLLVQDTTSLSLACEVEGAGPVGPHTHGLYVHSALAVSGQSHEVLGVLAQSVWAREERLPGTRGLRQQETGAQRKARPRRESLRWGEVALDASQALGPEAEGRPYAVHVFDREGDIFEALETLEALGDSFIVRAVRNRRLQAPCASYLVGHVQRQPVRGYTEVHVPAGPGRAERTARLAVRAAHVALLPPTNRNRRGEALAVNVVLAREVRTPANARPLCWLLLTREPVQTLEDCVAVLRAYSARWRIEEWHLGLKTGCGAETRQLHEAERVERFLAVCTVLSWAMLALRDAARATPSPPATCVLSAVQLTLLSALRPSLPPQPTAHQALRALASLGGFLGRKGDGEPGWRTLWRGLQKLLAAEDGYRLALAVSCSQDSG